MIKAIKKLGQNFITNQGIITKIVNNANLNKNDVVLEIGPGKGNLTKEIAQRVKKVIAVEKDQRLIYFLQEELKDYKNIEIVHEDIMNFQFPSTNYKIVANIPFYLTNHLIRKLLEADNQPEQITLIVQKEVAKRIVAKPPKTNILAISVNFYADAKYLFTIPKKYFHPKPKIDSALIQITPKRKYSVNSEKFFKLVKAGYSHPRKQLQNNLKSIMELPPEFKKARAENLSTEDWIKLLEML